MESYILHMWISRDVEVRLKRSAKTRPVIVLTGARQTGKTSTFRHLFPDYAFVSLDLPTEAEQAEKEPERFLQRHPPPVIIDEVQYAPGLFRHLSLIHIYSVMRLMAPPLPAASRPSNSTTTFSRSFLTHS